MTLENFYNHSENKEWYTPKQYMDVVRKVLGRIDLDPASNAIANEVVQARQYFTAKDDGLSQEWHGRVFLNPPYGRDTERKRLNQQVWSEKLVAEYKSGNVREAILLVNAVTDTKWFQPLWDYPICFTDHRIKFYTVEANKTSPVRGSAIVYFGDNPLLFAKNFKQFGKVVLKCY